MSLEIPRTRTHSVVETITLSADGTDDLTDLGKWLGYYLTQVHVLGSLDDAFTITINSHKGGEIGTLTTTAATSGEFMPLAASGAENRYLAGTPTYTLSGLGSGTVELECVLVT